MICRDCLPRLFDADKYRCPFCRKALFVYKSRTYRSCLWYIITAAKVLRRVLVPIALALQLYKGYYRAAAAKASSAAFSVALERHRLSRRNANGNLANMRLIFLFLELGTTVHAAWRAVAAVQTFDQVTLWDGAVLEGVEVWDTYEVVREWSGAVV